MQKINGNPTHSHNDFQLRGGRPLPLGATVISDGINFSLFSRYATACTLLLFDKESDQPFAKIPFPDEFRIGHLFTMVVCGLDHEKIAYGYQMDGPFDPANGHYFNPNQLLIDPYAKGVNGRELWRKQTSTQFRSLIIPDQFNWETDRPLEKPVEELIIYEMHLHGFTRHPTANVKHPGTYASMIEKIPYLKELGINCVELLPIHEFDELENKHINPETGEQLVNYWGYSTVNFFAPKAGYAATGQQGQQANELKSLIKSLHENDIEIILDVVYNHTAEMEAHMPTTSYRGLDNKTYYMLQSDGSYFNFSGCGNTMNCNTPVVRNMILDSLRYWVTEYHIDGFRFDLASILGRGEDGSPLSNPPLLELLAHDPILGRCKLIAEPWDASGLYQVGSFPSYGRWAEWNDKYRDTIRQFLKGDEGQVGDMAFRLQGSPDLYTGRGPTASINFITCHDGFTLRDLFSYNEKHNEANGEGNRDGSNNNLSWNCGWEGETDNLEINQLRRRMIKNSIVILMVSRGIPMILMGDEIGRTKQGNNNSYCQDNDLNWLNWSQKEENADIFRFFKQAIAFRKAHPSLYAPHFPQKAEKNNADFSGISWHGVQAWRPDWSYHSHTLAFMLAGVQSDDPIYVVMNMHWENHDFELPHLPDNMKWHLFVNSNLPSPQDIQKPGKELLLANQDSFDVALRSIVILVGR